MVIGRHPAEIQNNKKKAPLKKNGFSGQNLIKLRF